ncbi:MAG: ABC transporter permease [Meiothermus sp.]|nr:ABC transporter permease [Meiothermus sp.]
MAVYLLRRLITAVPVMLVVVLLVFLSLQLVPGDPVDFIIGPDTPYNIDREAYEAQIRQQLGLDRPLYEQFLRYVWGLVQFDFGTSIRSKLPVIEELIPRYQATLELAVFALLIAVAVGIPAGVIAAIRPNSWLDSLVTTLALMGISLPSFWFGLLLMLLFALQLGWLPPSGRPTSAFTAEGFAYVIMPAVTLGLGSAGLIMRLTRSQLLEVLGEDYVRTARAKGLPPSAVVLKHALRNALLPVVTVVGLQFGELLAGAVIVETVFSYPGVGSYLIQSVSNRDFPAVQSGVLFVSLTFVLVNLLVDALYSLVDPRIRYD